MWGGLYRPRLIMFRRVGEPPPLCGDGDVGKELKDVRTGLHVESALERAYRTQRGVPRPRMPFVRRHTQRHVVPRLRPPRLARDSAVTKPGYRGGGLGYAVANTPLGDVCGDVWEVAEMEEFPHVVTHVSKAGVGKGGGG